MNEIIIRNLDEASVRQLRQLALKDKRPLEEIVRALVLEAAKGREPKRFSENFPVPTD